MEKRPRIYYLDCLRVFACFLVVLTHSQMPNIEANGKILSAISFLCTPSSELFLALSGAILLPVHTTFRDFYKRRFLKLLPPMAIWSVVGIGLQMMQHQTDQGGAVKMLLQMPVKPVIGVYWFLYVMIGLYLFAPIISCWLREATKKQVEVFLVILGFNMLMPWVNLLVPGFYLQDGSYYWIFCYYGGFLGYWMLGYYLRKYPPKLLSVKGIAIICLSALYVIAILIMKLRGVESGDVTDNLQIGSAFLVALIFMVVKEISDSKFGQKFLNGPASKIAQYSFGIYLLHFYVIRDGIWRIMENHRMYNLPILETLIIVFSAMISCILFMRLLKTIYKPLGKWMFGLK